MDQEQVKNDVVARKGFFPVVAGRDVAVRQAGGVAFLARRDLALREGGGQWLVALGNQTIERGGGGMLISRQAHVNHGFVGLLVSGRTTVEGQARVFVTLPVATAAAVVVGVAVGLLFGRLGAGRGANSAA